MKTIPKAILDKLYTDAIADAFVPLLDFDLGAEGHLYYARYAGDVTYAGQVYTAWPFDSEIKTGGKGHTVTTTTMTIADGAHVLRPYALATGWFAGCTLTITVVCVGDLVVDYTWSTVAYDIKHAAPVGDDLVLKLGGRNPTKMRYPSDRYWADQCPYARGFKSDPRCGYSGAETSCNGSLARCEALGNEARFGGFLGLDPDGAKLVIPVGLRR
jgi:phage-related protein